MVLHADPLSKGGESQRLYERARDVAPLGVHGNGRWYEPNPLFFSRAAGARLWDADGKEYIDLHGGLGPCILGYNHPEVLQTAIEALTDKGPHLGLPHPAEVQLSQVLVDLIPCAEKVVLCGGGGSDPCYHAIRLSRAFTGRKKIIKFEGGQNGWADPLSMSITPTLEQAGPYERPNTVASPGTLPEVVENTTVLPVNDASVLERHLEQEGNQIAAIMVEPVMQGMGCVPLDPGYPKLLRQFCDHYGIVLIFDEIQTGFRHDLGGAQKLLGVTPDLATFGKAMANGFVISALAGRQQLMSMLQPEGPVHFSGTFNANVLGVHTSLKTIEILQRGNGEVYRRLFDMGRLLTEGLENAIGQHRVKARVQSFGSVFALYFADKPVRNYRDLAPLRTGRPAALRHAYRHYLIRHGIFVNAHAGNRAFLSAAHSDDDIARIVEVTSQFFGEHRRELQ
jgi:glutamate-1-semialdehyde 2,1-aminomutase